jgi:molybdate transport system regulatory protein
LTLRPLIWRKIVLVRGFKYQLFPGRSSMSKSRNDPEYRLEIDDKVILLDKKKFNLFKYIEMFGSITQAAQKSNIPYRSALKYIENLEHEVNDSLVLTKRGGRGGGGGSELTDTGKLLLREYRKIDSVLKMHIDVNEIESEIAEIDEDKKIIIVYVDDEKVILPLRGNFKIGEKVLILISPEDIFLTLQPQKSSVRNIFKGRITGMKLKDQMVRLNVEVGKIRLFADITEYSRDDLNLNLGREIFIGFKAAAIAVVKI